MVIIKAKKRNYAIAASCLALLVLAGLGAYLAQADRGLSWPVIKATLGGAKIGLEVANTQELRRQGLSDRISMPMNQGMLFVLPGSYRVSMVMRRMHFSLDFIWLKDGVVMGITPDIPYPSGGEAPRRVHPPIAVTGVIEVNAGWAAKNRIKPGDKLTVLDGAMPSASK